MNRLLAYAAVVFCMCLCSPSSPTAWGQCTPANCDDGNPDTCDFCDPFDGTCRHSTLPCVACCLPDGTCQNYPAPFCQSLGGSPQAAGVLCNMVECAPPQICQPLPDGSACSQGPCPAPNVCTPRCMRFNPATGQTIIIACDCRPSSACHVKAGAIGPPCDVPDTGIGTAHLLPPCDFSTPDDDLQIVDGLPPGSSIQIDATLGNINSQPEVPGGSLGGTISSFSSVLLMPLQGTGALAGYNRLTNIIINNGQAHLGPRTPGEPIQSFPCEMVQLNGQLPPGDPDFDLLRITVGSGFGLPSPGHTTLTQLPGGNWSVDSFFDITYRIDFIGAAGGVLGGMSGSTTGTARIKLGKGVPTCAGVCPTGFACNTIASMNADGTLDVCCDCIPSQTNGACCLESGQCVVILQEECKKAGGVFLGNGTNCGTLQACCLPTGGCVDAYDICCTNLFGGVPQGAGTSCQNNPCGPTEEACCLPDGTCVMVPNAGFCLEQNGVPQGPGSNCVGITCPAQDCIPDASGTHCSNFQCPNDGEECLPACVIIDPATGQSTVVNCDCRLPQECHVETGGFGPPCIRPDNGSGSADLPPVGCTYTTPNGDMNIVDGLPPASSIQIDASKGNFLCVPASGVCSFPPGVDCREPGGSLGGEKACYDASLNMPMIGTGAMAGFNRNIALPISHEIHMAPRSNGSPIQPFDTVMFRLFGQITGDPDFDLLRVVAGTDFGLPSPGHTTLTQAPGGNWAVDSFFDITYRIDFVGAPGGSLAGMSGSTTGTVRFHVGGGGSYCAGQCPPGFICQTQTIVNADGTIQLCCNCVPDGPQEGACCLQSGICVLSTPTQCQGTYLGDGTTCLGIQACCRSDGTCLDVDAACCTAFGGTPQGAGTTCETTTCEPPVCGPDPNAPRCLPVQCPIPGQACLPRCVVLDAAGNPINVADCECRDDTLCHMQWFPGADPQCVGGCPPGFQCVTTTVTNPDGTTSICCDCVPETPTGACCTTTGVCVITTAAQCVGSYLGDGTICLGVQACCRQDGTCIDVDAACCTAFGGTPQGAGTICEDVICQPPVCGPDPTGTSCLPVQCPIPGQACLPRCVLLDAAGIPIGVTDCECRDDISCFMHWVPGTPPQCIGDCPPGFFCVTTTVTNPDGTISQCCDCVPETPTGACCTQDGICIITTATQCPGTYLGDGTICLGVQACCRPNGTCIDADAACCTFFGGTPQGPGTNCGNVECIPPQCGPDPNAPRCLPVQCPIDGDECLPRCVIVENGQVVDVLGCDCQSPNECHIEWVAGAPPQCVGGCPPGFVCEQQVTTTPIGAQICCVCVPETPDDCEPAAGGQACLPTACELPDEVCAPRCIRFNPATGQSIIVDCDCRGEGECQAVFDAAVGPACAGNCPPGTVCVENRVVLADGSIEVCCDCAAPPCECPGDINGDGTLDGLDLPGFVRCLLGTAIPGDNCGCADADGDGIVNQLDIPIFIDLVLSKAPCDPCSCPSEDLFIDLSTGVDDNGNVIPIGSPDDTWTVVSEPPPVGVLPRAANVINPNPAWLTIPGTRWISANQTGPNGTYVYEFCFCLDQRFMNAVLDLQLRADDRASVFLNGNFVGATPPIYAFNTPLPTPIFTNNQSFFRSGENCVRIVVENTHGVVTGFNMAGSVSAAKGKCCCPPADIDRDIDTGVDAAGNLIPIGNDDDDWEVIVDAAGGTTPRPATVINAHPAWLTIPGTQWISAAATGPNGLYVYRFCFCLDGRFKNPVLTLASRADDAGQIFLNGVLIGPTGGFNAPQPLVHTVTNASLFVCGENCIEVHVQNLGGVVTGFNMAANIRAEDGLCCDDQNPTCEPRPNGQGCRPVRCPLSGQECLPRCVIVDIDGTVSGVADCDCRSPNECHITFEPGAGINCVGQCPPGFVCTTTSLVQPDGRVIVCCDCEPEDPPTGACCLPTGPCINSTAQDCELQGGVYLGDGVVCDAALVYCCLPDGHCIPTNILCCEARGGMPTPNNVPCAGDANGDGVDDACLPPPDECLPAPTGFGCLPSQCPNSAEVCLPRCVRQVPGTTIFEVVDCDCRSPLDCHVELSPQPVQPICVGDCPPGTHCERKQSVDPLGNLIICCDCVPDEPGGVCCLLDGPCITTSAADCQAQGGVFLGAGACDDAVVFCCLPDGTCVTTNVVCCQARGGSPTPNGAPCAGDLDGDGHDDACQDPGPGCLPNTAGTDCMPTICPVQGEECRPTKAIRTPDGLITVVECSCASPNTCHLELGGGAFECVGQSCAAGQNCNPVIVDLGGGSFEIRCECQ